MSGNAASQERNAGLLLIAAALMALVAANSPLEPGYRALLGAALGPLTLAHWVADGAMALFFLLVGLEVKREWFFGRLATPAARRLPVIAAAAGMAVPALVYLAAAGGDAALRAGWAIPAATDIAFALGILALLGSRAPPALKLLLVTIAVIDDIGAVSIIALAYTRELDWRALAIAAIILIAMIAMTRRGVGRLAPFLLGFALLWGAMLQSGVHATVAGVLAALTVPLGRKDGPSPLKRLEHHLHPWVMFGVVPLFALTSAGVTFRLPARTGVLPVAIFFGLVLGKQAGVFGAIWIADRTRIARKPESLSWRQIYGGALLCGIGFTMSLFIAALAFPSDPNLVEAAKFGILAGSVASVVLGVLILRWGPVATAWDPNMGDAEDVFAIAEDPARPNADAAQE